MEWSIARLCVGKTFKFSNIIAFAEPFLNLNYNHLVKNIKGLLGILYNRKETWEGSSSKAFSTTFARLWQINENCIQSGDFSLTWDQTELFWLDTIAAPSEP